MRNGDEGKGQKRGGGRAKAGSGHFGKVPSLQQRCVFVQAVEIIGIMRRAALRVVDENVAPSRPSKDLASSVRPAGTVCRPTTASAMKRKAAATPDAPSHFLKKADGVNKRSRQPDTAAASPASPSQHRIQDKNLTLLLTAKIKEAQLLHMVREAAGVAFSNLACLFVRPVC